MKCRATGTAVVESQHGHAYHGSRFGQVVTLTCELDTHDEHTPHSQRLGKWRARWYHEPLHLRTGREG